MVARSVGCMGWVVELGKLGVWWDMLVVGRDGLGWVEQLLPSVERMQSVHDLSCNVAVHLG